MTDTRQVRAAKRLLESKGYKVVHEAELRIPQDKMWDPDKVDLKSIGKKAMEDEATAKAEAEKQAQRDMMREKYASLLDDIESSSDPIQTAFDALVPPSGPADTVAGELVRAMMRILYRDFNDGDVFYEGYGRETCGSSAVYLMYKIEDLYYDFEQIAQRTLEDDRYTSALHDISAKVLAHIKENPELLSEPNTEDSRDYDEDEMPSDWEPRYEISLNLPDNLIAHIERGNVTKADVEWSMSSWEGLRDAEVSVYDEYVDIEDITRDVYEEINYHGYNWLEQYADELDEEYGDPFEEEEEDYEDEEEEDEEY